VTLAIVGVTWATIVNGKRQKAMLASNGRNFILIIESSFMRLMSAIQHLTLLHRLSDAEEQWGRGQPPQETIPGRVRRSDLSHQSHAFRYPVQLKILTTVSVRFCRHRQSILIFLEL
jgi:hypothetical protein